MCKPFSKVKNIYEVRDYLQTKYSQKTMDFDGYEPYPDALNKRYHTYYKFYPPRYNQKTKLFVAQHGGRSGAMLLYAEAIQHITHFERRNAVDCRHEDALIVTAMTHEGPVYIKLFNRVIGGQESPVVVFHN